MKRARMTVMATARRLAEGEEVEVDARLDEGVWDRASWTGGFVQIEPVEGARPTVRTEIAFTRDGTTLYVAGRMHDPEPSRIRVNLARRDRTGESDRVAGGVDVTYTENRVGTFRTWSAATELEGT